MPAVSNNVPENISQQTTYGVVIGAESRSVMGVKGEGTKQNNM
jgi:hypothetical protein